ncbi:MULTISPECIES: hypothetical protein [unclassified Streptomyces]|uniref:hypothetical protein n=1 Tax=unclassified Streptomyces TaxID=2593676 RepID=UPI000A91ED7F|nr:MULTISPECIES: hypothetical protein [unclassified Streptomyces]
MEEEALNPAMFGGFVCRSSGARLFADRIDQALGNAIIDLLAWARTAADTEPPKQTSTSTRINPGLPRDAAPVAGGAPIRRRAAADPVPSLPTFLRATTGSDTGGAGRLLHGPETCVPSAGRQFRALW